MRFRNSKLCIDICYEVDGITGAIDLFSFFNNIQRILIRIPK